MFKTVALDLLDEAGVRYLFHAFASGIVDDDGRWAVVFETKSGPVVVRSRAVVDGTGDGDVAAAAGEDYDIGSPTDGRVQPMTLMFRVVDFHRGAFDAYVKARPEQWRRVHGLWELVEQATAAGDLDLPPRGRPLLRDAASAGGRGELVTGADGAPRRPGRRGATGALRRQGADLGEQAA